MSGLIHRTKATIPIANAAPGKVIEGVDIADGLLYIKDELGVVTKFQTSSTVTLLINAALAGYDLSTVVDSKISVAINNLIGGAPAFLDTLDEIAAAIADDDNFATTVTNQLALKADKSIQIDSVAGETTGGGDLNANRTIGLADVGTAGSSSNAAQTLDITVDAKGRVTSFSRTSIQIATSQVTSLAAFIRSTVLTGISFATNSAVLATDTILIAIGKLQAQLNDIYVDGFNLAAGIATNLTGFQTFVNHNFTLPSNGDYILTVMGGGSINATDNDIATQITVINDGNTVGPIKMAQFEGKEAGGSGPTFDAVEGGTIDVGTDQLIPFCYQQRYNGQVAGTFNVLLEFAQGGFDGNDEAAIHHCSIKIEKVKA